MAQSRDVEIGEDRPPGASANPARTCGAGAVGTSFQPLLAPNDRSPLQRQLYVSVRDAIIGGRLLPGARVPSSRELARELRVARMTVVLAYDALRSEGYLVGRPGSGTFVSPDAASMIRSVAARSREHSADPPRAAGRGAPSARPRRAAPFRVGEPAIDLFPLALWRRLVARRWRTASRWLLGYAEPAGRPTLRRAIAEHLAARRGVRAAPEQVVITHGAQQALDLIARVLLAPGDVVGVEDPGYPRGRSALCSTGATLAPIPVDLHGMVVRALAEFAPGARVVYLTPSHQFPTGVTMSFGRRREILAWAHDVDAWVIEDDYDSEFRYTSAPIASLQGLDGGRRVLYVGSFSKTMFPGLGVGYVIVPESLVDRFRRARARLDHHGGGAEHAALLDFIQEGHYGRHLRRMRLAYADRRDALLAALEPATPALLELGPCDAGLHLTAWLSRATDGEWVSRETRRRGLSVLRVRSCAIRPQSRDGLLLGFGGFPPDELSRAGGILRDVLEMYPVGRRPRDADDR